MKEVTGCRNAVNLRALHSARVFVTGAAGFIGKHLCRALLAEGAELTVLHRGRVLDAPQGVRSLSVELEDRAAVALALRDTKPDVVFHLAGFASGERDRQAMALAFDANVQVSANLLLTCLTELPATRVITTTSLETSNPLREAASTGSPYGISKLMVEIMSGCLHELYCVPLHTARLGLVYGPGDDNLARVVPTVITSLLRGRSPRLSSGRRRFDWVYIDDVTRGLLAMATVATLPAAALDLGSGALCSVREVAETIWALSGATCPVLFDPTLDRPHEQERCADMHAAHSALQLGPATALHEGLSRTIAWYRSHSEGRQR